MSIKMNKRAAWVLAAAVCLMAPGAGAQEVAWVDVGAGGLSFSPVEGFGGIVLTVKGNGRYVRQEFGAGDRVSFTPVDSFGEALPDGTYVWELRARPRIEELDPSEFVNGRMTEDASGSRDAVAPRGRVQNGAFTISGGSIVDPTLEEPEPMAPAGGTELPGDLVAGGAKHFSVIDPEDSDRAIYYAALEGPEAGTYYRGNARTVDGEAVVELPAHFAKVTEAEGVTVQLTPLGGWSQLYVAEMSPERLVVRDAEGRDGIEFSFLVQGVRKGYAGYQVERAAGSVGR